MEFRPHLSLVQSLNNSTKLCTVSHVRGFEILSDEPINHGGENLAPSPFDLLNASLASCTAIFLRKFASKNAIHTGDINLRIKLSKAENGIGFHFDRKITTQNEISSYEKNLLLEQSEKTPTTLALIQGNTIQTEIF